LKEKFTWFWRKDGSLTDIKVLRDIGYGTGKEAIRVLTKVRDGIRYSNGKPVILFSDQIQTAD
jgi:protein TonB